MNRLDLLGSRVGRALGAHCSYIKFAHLPNSDYETRPLKREFNGCYRSDRQLPYRNSLTFFAGSEYHGTSLGASESG